MRVVDNEDGTVTVIIPKSPEVYNAATGELEVHETIDKDDYKAASKPAKPE